MMFTVLILGSSRSDEPCEYSGNLQWLLSFIESQLELDPSARIAINPTGAIVTEFWAMRERRQG